jgi:catalase
MKDSSMRDRQLPTASSGMPAGDNQNSLSAGPRGAESMQEWLMIDKLAQH